MARLVVITGPAASGKTTFAHVLAGRMPAAVVDYDTVSIPLLSAFSRHSGIPIEAVCGLFRDACYEAALGIAAENLQHGGTVILCAPFGREIETTDFFKAFKAKENLEFEVIECRIHVSAETLAERVVDRRLPRDAAKISDPLAYARRSLERRHLWDPDRIIPIDADCAMSGLEKQAQRIAKDLSASADRYA